LKEVWFSCIVRHKDPNKLCPGCFLECNMTIGALEVTDYLTFVCPATEITG